MIPITKNIALNSGMDHSIVECLVFYDGIKYEASDEFHLHSVYIYYVNIISFVVCWRRML